MIIYKDLQFRWLYNRYLAIGFNVIFHPIRIIISISSNHYYYPSVDIRPDKYIELERD